MQIGFDFVVVLGHYTKILPTRWLKQKMFISDVHKSCKSQVKLQAMLVSFGNLLMDWSVVSISLHAHRPSFFLCMHRKNADWVSSEGRGETYQRPHNLDFI